jgi:hypothetical protein
MSFSNYLENKILNHLFGKSAYTAPTIYVGLSTADPGEDGAGLAEHSGDGYARVQTSGSTWNTATTGSTTNAAAIEFPTATDSWGEITHWALFDAPTGGNLLASGQLTTARIVVAADTPKLAIGDGVITLD